MYIVDRFSVRPGGDAVPVNSPVTLKLIADGTVLDTQYTDADGFVTFQSNGSPGPIYLECTVGSVVLRRYGTAVTQVGTWFEGEWRHFMQMVAAGVVANVSDEMTVTAGTGMQVEIGAGSAFADGLIGTYYDPTFMAIAANTSGNPRIDVVGIQFFTEGVLEGANEPVIVLGTAAASPVAPAYSGPAGTTFVELAQVRVPHGAASITSSDITDVRIYASTLIADSVTSDKIAANAVTNAHIADLAVTGAKMANSTITAAKIVNGTITAEKIASGTLTATQIGDGTITAAKLAANTLTANQIGPDAITSSELAALSVTEAKLANSSVGTSKLGNNVVTWDKLGVGSVFGNRIPDDTIIEGQLHDDVKAKIGPHTRSNLFDWNKVTNTQTDLRGGPNTSHATHNVVVVGTACYDTGWRATGNSVQWAYVWTNGYGFGWLLASTLTDYP